jgi:ABC-type multidrug transport system ATPase subunit
MGGKNIFPNHIYVFPKGSSIKSDGFAPLYFGDIVSAFRKGVNYPKIFYLAEKIEFTYPKSDNGIHALSLSFFSGEMIGVMGGSGAGKSTLMSLLNGNIKPDRGTIYINGKELGSDVEAHKGIIGFVPQDDLLIEELSVFDNLYYNAKLCLGNLEEKEIIKRIGKVLNSLDLFYIKNLKVGSPLNKYISGGQRKRLNIALELIREPYILFVDEPTSGLSSTDSENVLILLKEQALSGKIVVINIHQPSSDMFKQFDKAVILDKGGYTVYFGNPLDSISYLKNIAKRADAEEIQCESCGVVQTEDILKIIEAKKVNEFGEYTKERVLEPSDWYELFNEKIELAGQDQNDETLPDLNFKIPSRSKQFWIYSQRNFFSKLADTQFVVLSLTISPLLALILSFFTKYPGGVDGDIPTYVMSLNENMAAYLFMSVIVSLFIGLIVSAEEIIGDNKIQSREAFLNLSKYSYFNSKITFLFILSAFQMLVFVLLGNSILKVEGLNFNYWIILFSTSCFAVMLGLNISAGLKTVKSIYINIPFILVPLILLSGVIVKYDKLHPKVAGIENVPLVGDMMASRWAYEALVVNQFKNNAFESHFFIVDQDIANAQYNINFLIPELNNRIGDLQLALINGNKNKAEKLNAQVMNNLMDIQSPAVEFYNYERQAPDFKLMYKFLNQWKEYLINKSSELSSRKDFLVDSISKELGGPEALVELKQRNHNESIAELVLGSNDLKKIIEFNGRLVRKETPIFQKPVSTHGRAHFFSATKNIGSWEIDTIMFNVLILWLMTFILYIALINDWLKKLLFFFERKK